MKAFAFIITLVFFINLSAVPVASDINDTIKNIVSAMFQVWVPENFEAKDIHLTFKGNDYMSGELDINDITISKLRDIKLETSYQPGDLTDRITIDINFNDIVTHVNSLFKISFVNAIDIVRDDVDISVDLEKLGVTFDIVVVKDRIQFVDLSVKVNLEQSDVVIQGLLEDDALNKKISNVLSSNLPKILNTFYDEIAAEFSVALLNHINQLLEGILN